MTIDHAVLPAPLARRRTALDDLVREVVALGGDACRAILAYGPAVAGHADAPIETAIVLARDDLALVRALARRGARFERRGIAAPLVLTEDGIARSRDSFPLELLDLAQCHHRLHGADVVSALVFAPADVRVQCERQLTMLLITMRRRVLAAAGDEASLTAHDLAAEVVRVARGLLLLRGRTAPVDAVATLGEAGSACGHRLAATIAAWSGATGWDAFAACYDEIAELARLVDAS